jgi:hypothetical protein
MFDSSSPQFFDEADTEADENCRFHVEDGAIQVISTRPIGRFEQCLTRYGHLYWCKSKWPIALLRLMFTKYKPTLDNTEVAKWRQVMTEREALDQIQAY